MDEVNNTLPASEHETFALEDDGREGKYQSPDNARDDESSASSSTHSTSGVVSASSPGSQRDFYSHVSGAGDGFSLQTSEGDTQKTLNGIKMEGEEPVVVRSSAAEFEENNRNGVNLRDISKDWSNKIQRLNRTIQAVLKNVPDPNKVDVSIGKTPILRDKEVVLALHKAPKRLDQSMDSGLFSPPGISDIKFTETQDGIVLYCVIRVREDFQDSTDNETSAIKDIFRQACSSPDQIVPKINLDAFDLGDKIKRRSPKSRKSPRRSPTKGSPRKSGVDGEERDSEGRQLQGGKDYEDEDMYSTSSDFDDEEYTTEAENEEYKHRRGVGIKDDDDYRIMRSRPAEPGSPTKKSVTWRKEIDRRDGSADKKDTSPKRGSKETTGSGSRTGSRESSASSPRRKGTSDTDSPKSGSRRSSMSPRRRGSSESKGTDEDSPKSGSRRSSSEQSPRRNDTNGSKRGSDESVRFDQNGYVEDMSNGRQQIDIDEQDYGGKAEIGARSRALRKDENGSDRRKYRNEYDHGKQIIDSSYDEYSLEDERKLFLKLDDSMSSHEKERLIRRRRTALRRRRRRAEQLKSGEPFDVQLSETEGSNGERRPRTAKEKHHINKLRREYLNPDIDAIDGDDYKEYDPDYDRNGDERHDACFLPFEGYDENYDGPIGVLTSKLPDGSSTAEHDPIVISQKERVQFRNELFGTTHKPSDEANSSRAQLPLTVFNGSEIKGEPDVNGNRVLWRAQQIPNRIRRLRSRHVPLGDKLWFNASNSLSFNSRCPSAFRFDRKNLDEDARQYYFYRSLPRIHPSSVGLTNAGKQEPESIFLGGPVVDPPSTPPAKKAAAERAKMREKLLL